MSNENIHKIKDNFCKDRIVNVGTHKVKIIEHIAEGGFAQIYSVQFLEYLNDSDGLLEKNDIACLKRVLVNDENGLNELRNEVGVMQKLKGKSNIVQFFDSNATHRSDNKPGYEVLLLMELCPNKSLLDYMNQRLATKLTEQEILKIMFDVTLGIAHMHFLEQPLIHRDIKIENVLVDANHDFKLCDFGSTSTCFPVATTHHDIALLAQNIYVHTTPQYRSPEMVDLYRCLPINEKSDIWALGIFLYKLLFFTTPFERTGQFAILHSKYEFPVNNYSSRLVNLIIIMLSENPNLRPNIWQILYEICSMIDVKVPINDKYLQGPYNFQDYSFFQNKLQGIQNQLFDLQSRKLIGRLDNKDNHLLNELFMSAFNVVPIIPLPSDTTLPIPSISNSGVPLPALSNTNVLNTEAEINKGQNNNMQNYNPSNGPIFNTNNQNTFSQEDKFQDDTLTMDQERDDVQPISSQDVEIKNETDDKIEDHYYPTLNEINQNTSDKNFNAINDMVPTNNTSTVLPNNDMSKRNLSVRQFKSNNPFPMMQMENNNTAASYQYQNAMSKTAISSNNPYTISQQQQQQIMHNGTSASIQPSPNLPTAILQNSAGIPIPVIQNSSNMQPVANMQSSPNVPNLNIIQSPINVPPVNFSPMQGSLQSPSNTQYIGDNNKIENAFEKNSRAASILPTSPSNVPIDNKENRDIDSISSISKPPKLPPHPKRKSVDISSDSSSKSPPIIPPHPKKKLDESIINLYSNSENKSKSTSGFNSGSNFDSKNLPSDSNSSSSNPRKMILIEPPTSESIEFNFEEAQKKALNSKLEKLVIQNKDTLQTKDSFSRHNVSSITLSQEELGMEELKANAKNVRKSLDLERSREELFTESSKKHGGLFSLLKGDRKH